MRTWLACVALTVQRVYCLPYGLDLENFLWIRKLYTSGGFLEWMRDWKAHVVLNHVELRKRIAGMYKLPGAYIPEEKCFNATSWYSQLQNQPKWSRFSQRWHDSILASLFLETNLGTSNKQYVEFGFPGQGYGSVYQFSVGGLLTAMFHDDFGWTGVLFDSEMAHVGSNLHKEFVTPANIISIFTKHGVLREPDLVSIDIDSCDIWVFLSLTEYYRPRAVVIEYNAAFQMGESLAVRCTSASGERHPWTGHSHIWGASLPAIEKAGRMRGYNIVSVIPMDAILVRSDLLCQDTGPQFETFANNTGLIFFAHKAKPSRAEIDEWIVTF